MAGNNIATRETEIEVRIIFPVLIKTRRPRGESRAAEGGIEGQNLARKPIDMIRPSGFDTKPL